MATLNVSFQSYLLFLWLILFHWRVLVLILLALQSLDELLQITTVCCRHCIVVQLELRHDWSKLSGLQRSGEGGERLLELRGRNGVLELLLGAFTGFNGRQMRQQRFGALSVVGNAANRFCIDRCRQVDGLSA